MLSDVYLFEHFWNLGPEAFCSEKLLRLFVAAQMCNTCARQITVYTEVDARGNIQNSLKTWDLTRILLEIKCVKIKSVQNLVF